MTHLIVWYGHVTTRPRAVAKGVLLALPGMAWLLLLLLLPALALVPLAFLSTNRYGQVEWDWTLDNAWRVLGYTQTFGWTGDYLKVLGRSLLVAAVTTALCLALAYPLSFWIAGKPRRSRYLWLALIVVPICTNVVIRTYAWRLILEGNMPLAMAAQKLGLLDPHRGLYPSAFAVYVGMATTFLPFAVLPVYTNVERLDWSIVEACKDLYASKVRIFVHAILPQTLPGLAVAVLLTFVPAMGMFVVPDLLGGGKFDLVGNVIERQFKSSRNWPLGAALSLTLMSLTLAGVMMAWRFGRKAEAKN